MGRSLPTWTDRSPVPTPDPSPSARQFITAALPRLPAATAALLLLTQPAGALVLGYLLFDEQPSPLQWLGVLTVLAAVTFSSVRRRPAVHTRRHPQQEHP